MPDEEVRGFGPAALENPDAEKTPIEKENQPEVIPSAPEAEGVAPESGKKYEKLLSSVAQSTTVINNDDAKTDAGNIHALEDETEKINQLVKLAQAKGLPHAVKVATELKDYYALDMFHDTLADDLYDSLVQQGLITKE